MAPPQLGAPGAPDRLGPLRPPASRSAAACTRTFLVPGTRGPARVQGPTRSEAQPGTARAPCAAATRGPRCRHRPRAVAPAPPPESRGLSAAEVCPRPSPYRLVCYHAAVRGPGERRRENGGRDRPGRGFYQVSGRGASCRRPEGRAGSRAPGPARVLVAGSRGGLFRLQFFPQDLRK